MSADVRAVTAVVSAVDSEGNEHGRFAIRCRYIPDGGGDRGNLDVLAGRGVAFADDDSASARESWRIVGSALGGKRRDIRVRWADAEGGIPADSADMVTCEYAQDALDRLNTAIFLSERANGLGVPKRKKRA